MNILAQFDPKTHAQLSDKSTPWMTLAGLLKSPLVGCQIVDSPYKDLGAKAVRAWAPAGAAVNCQFRQALEKPQADIETGWRWHRWPIVIPQDTLLATAKSGQIKLFLSRTGASNGFVTLGEGWEFNSQNNAISACEDWQTMPFGRGPAITPGVVHWVEVGEHRDPVNHVGTAVVFWDEVLVGQRTEVHLGDDDPRLVRGASFGLVYTQHSSGPTEVYTGAVTISDARVGGQPIPVILPPVVPPVVVPPVVPPVVTPPVVPPAVNPSNAEMLLRAFRGIPGVVTGAAPGMITVTFPDGDRFDVTAAHA